MCSTLTRSLQIYNRVSSKSSSHSVRMPTCSGINERPDIAVRKLLPYLRSLMPMKLSINTLVKIDSLMFKIRPHRMAPASRRMSTPAIAFGIVSIECTSTAQMPLTRRDRHLLHYTFRSDVCFRREYREKLTVLLTSPTAGLQTIVAQTKWPFIVRATVSFNMRKSRGRYISLTRYRRRSSVVPRDQGSVYRSRRSGDPR